MSLNQQLREPRVLTIAPRLVALMALAAAALLVVGCRSSEPLQKPAPPRSSAPESTRDPADDMTATEAAISGLSEAPAAEQTAQTSQLLRPDAPMNYSVKRGDTLWDISAVFLKDPWFWPEIWQINPQVENPHLIYPGDVLSLAIGAGGDARVFISQYAAPPEAAPASEASTATSTQSRSLARRVPVQAHRAVKDQALEAPYIMAFRNEHMIGGTGHEFYAKDLNAGLNQRYSVMHIGDPIRDIGSREILGYQAAYVATAVVNNPGEISKAVLTEGAREALEGDRLIFQEGEVSLTFTPHAPTNTVDGQIIAVADGAEQIGQYQVVVLNRGANDGLAAGAVLAIDQLGAVVKDKYGTYPWKKKAWAKDVRLPRTRRRCRSVFVAQLRAGIAPSARRVADRIYNPRIRRPAHFWTNRLDRASREAGPFVLGCRDGRDFVAASGQRRPRRFVGHAAGWHRGAGARARRIAPDRARPAGVARANYPRH